MSDIWIVLLWLPLAFVVGGMLGYRVGVIHGYDEAAGFIAPAASRLASEAADRRLLAAGEKQNSGQQPTASSQQPERSEQP